TGVKYSPMYHSSYDNLCDILEKEPRACELILKSKRIEELRDRLKHASNRDGRLGLKGLLYFREMQRKYKVICSKPVHLYYTKPMIGKTGDASTGVWYPDAVYDCIIRHEIEFIRDNTNLDVLFLTADKNNDETCETEGLMHQYVQQPVSWLDVNYQGARVINTTHVERLLVELMTFSPYVRVSTDDDDTEPFYLAYTWIGKLPEENLNGHVQYLAEYEDDGRGSEKIIYYIKI
ncbi:MAG: hypothetical protein ACXQS8_02505, partial [Candidatus Helarchaeales archaeon]